MGKAWLGLVGGLAVILTGALLAWLVQTAGGVSVRDVRFAGDRGTTLAALVYIHFCLESLRRLRQGAVVTIPSRSEA